MDRQIVKIDSSHDAQICTMQSASERDGYLRIFPHPMPVGYVLKHRWLSEMKLKLWVEAVPAVAVAVAVAAPAVTATPTAPLAAPTPINPPEQGDPVAVPMPASVRRAELEAMNTPDLLTLGAEVGARVSNKQSKAVMAGLILAAEQRRALTPAA